MNHFLKRLPWRVASLAGLLVGGVSLAVGVDPWNCLLRVGVAFIVFGVAGLGLRAILMQDSHLQDSHSVSPDARGHHFDQTTPDELVGDPAPDSSESSSKTDSGDSP